MSLQWTPARPVGKPPKMYNVTSFEWAGALFATNNSGGVARLTAKGWDGVVSDSEAAPVLGPRVGLQLRFVGWGGHLCGLASSGAVLSLDESNRAWRVLCPPDPTPKMTWPLAGFDSERQVLVVWGPQKSNGLRQDATWLFDGTRWSKAKKGAPMPVEDLQEEAGAFNLSYHRALGGVVRLGKTSAAFWSGTAWQPLSLVGGESLHTWERVTFQLPATGQVFLAQRFASDPSLVELEVADTTVTVRKAAELPLAVERADNTNGSNVAYDVGGFDEERAVLVALDEQKGTVRELSLASLTSKSKARATNRRQP